jgi:WXXGXW repeat (2 copies)
MRTPTPRTYGSCRNLAFHGLELSLLAAAALLAGCASEPESHLVAAPPPAGTTVVAQPAVVTSQTTTTTANGQTVTTQTQPVGTVVYQPMPVVQTDVVTTQPSPDFVWIPGHWTWRQSAYVWLAGHWEFPPHGNATWVGPHCEPEGGAFRFYEGYWE